MIEYRVIEDNDIYTIFKKDAEVLRAVLRDGWFGALRTNIFQNGGVILSTLQKKIFWIKSIKILQLSIPCTNPGTIKFIYVDGRLCLLKGDDLFRAKKKSWGNPAWTLFLNENKIGEIHVSSGIRLGKSSEYRLFFHEENESNFFSMISYFNCLHTGIMD